MTKEELDEIRLRVETARSTPVDAASLLTEVERLLAVLNDPPAVVEHWLGVAYEKKERAAVLAEHERLRTEYKNGYCPICGADSSPDSRPNFD